MDYSKLASETRALYRAFRDELFRPEEAYELTKVCIREYPIFREMIKTEPEVSCFGYVHLIDGAKIPIHTVISYGTNRREVWTKDAKYREETFTESDLNGVIEKARYLLYDDASKEWRQIYIVDWIQVHNV